MHIPATLHPAAAETLLRWHAMIGSRDFTGLDALIHPDALFRSPMAFTPYRSAAALEMVLLAATEIIEDFTDHREMAGGGGFDAALEFSGHVGDKHLKGVDFIRFAEDGRFAEFEVMARPMSGLQALGEAMAARIGKTLSGYRDVA